LSGTVARGVRLALLSAKLSAQFRAGSDSCVAARALWALRADSWRRSQAAAAPDGLGVAETGVGDLEIWSASAFGGSLGAWRGGEARSGALVIPGAAPPGEDELILAEMRMSPRTENRCWS